MKRLVVAFVAGLSLLVLSCQRKDALEGFKEPIKSLKGSWKIIKLLRNGEDMTGRVDFSKFRIVFTDSTFETQDRAPFIVDSVGQWRFDDPQYPVSLFFKERGADTELEPKFKYLIVGGVRNMILDFSPGCVKNTYQYTLVPASDLAE